MSETKKCSWCGKSKKECEWCGIKPKEDENN